MKIEKGTKNYPTKLLNHLKDPQDIYIKGDVSLFDYPAIGVVGSRKCTSYGIGVAEKIGEMAAKYGVVVISGMASGIDSAAHKGALRAGGKTIAVLGSGVDVIYPKSNRALYEEIAAAHLIVSEYPDGSEATPYTFPIRNRIISALSEAVIVVESGVRGGSLITAECAVEQGKELYAVPGNINSVYSLGTNKLIYDGAKPLVYIEEIFQEMGLKRPESENSIKLGEDERRIYDEVAKKGEISISALCEILEMKASEINPLLSILEIKGAIYCEMGKVMIANFS